MNIFVSVYSFQTAEVQINKVRLYHPKIFQNAGIPKGIATVFYCTSPRRPQGHGGGATRETDKVRAREREGERD